MIFGQLERYIEFKFGNEVMKETSMFVHLGIPLYTKSSLENEIIGTKIRGVYKKVWMLLNIGSKNA